MCAGEARGLPRTAGTRRIAYATAEANSNRPKARASEVPAEESTRRREVSAARTKRTAAQTIASAAKCGVNQTHRSCEHAHVAVQTRTSSPRLAPRRQCCTLTHSLGSSPESALHRHGTRRSTRFAEAVTIRARQSEGACRVVIKDLASCYIWSCGYTSAPSERRSIGRSYKWAREAQEKGNKRGCEAGRRVPRRDAFRLSVCRVEVDGEGAHRRAAAENKAANRRRGAP